MNARGRRPAERLLAPPGPLLDSALSFSVWISIAMDDNFYSVLRVEKVQLLLDGLDYCGLSKHCVAKHLSQSMIRP